MRLVLKLHTGGIKTSHSNKINTTVVVITITIFPYEIKLEKPPKKNEQDVCVYYTEVSGVVEHEVRTRLKMEGGRVASVLRLERLWTMLSSTFSERKLTILLPQKIGRLGSCHFHVTIHI